MENSIDPKKFIPTEFNEDENPVIPNEFNISKVEQEEIVEENTMDQVQEEIETQEEVIEPAEESFTENAVDVIEKKDEQIEELKKQILKLEQEKQKSMEEISGHKLEDPFDSNTREASYTSRFLRETTILPIDNTNEVNEHKLRFVDIEVDKEAEQKAENFYNSLSEESAMIYQDAMENNNLTSQGAFGSQLGKEFQKSELSNSVEYGNVKLGISKFGMSDQTINSKDPNIQFARFTSLLGANSNIHVTLYHSGFTISMWAPTQLELSNLQMEIYLQELDLGYRTGTYFISAKRGKAMEIIKNYVLDKIISWTLDVDKSEIFNHISILDFDLILLGILCGAYVNKIDVTRICRNVLKEKPDGSARCDHIVRAKVNPYKLLYVNRRFFDRNMINTLAKRKPKTVSIPEQANYVNTLREKIRNIRKNDYSKEYDFYGNEYYLEFKVPTIEEYIKHSELWFENVMSMVEKLLETSTKISRNKAINNIDNNAKLSSIGSTIDRIGTRNQATGNIEYFDNMEAIEKIISNTSTDIEVSVKVQRDIMEFIDKSAIAYVAIPNYVCPRCKNLNEDVNETLKEEGLISINVIDFLFTMVGDRTDRAVLKQGSGF